LPTGPGNTFLNVRSPGAAILPEKAKVPRFRRFTRLLPLSPVFSALAETSFSCTIEKKYLGINGMYHRAALVVALVLLAILVLQSAWKFIRKRRPVSYAFSSLGVAERAVCRYLVNPDRLLAQHRLLPGAYVLMVGPDPRLFSLKIARLITPGWLTCLDTEPMRLRTIKKAAQEGGINNIVTLAGDATHMPFPAGRFDQVILINSLGKIADQETALAEIARVLKDNGRLTVSDSVLAPDCEPPRRVVGLAARAGFVQHRRTNNVFFYTLEMVKPLKTKEQNPAVIDRKAMSGRRDMVWPERLHG